MFRGSALSNVLVDRTVISQHVTVSDIVLTDGTPIQLLIYVFLIVHLPFLLIILPGAVYLSVQ